MSKNELIKHIQIACSVKGIDITDNKFRSWDKETLLMYLKLVRSA